jgi:hypothetical protein
MKRVLGSAPWVVCVWMVACQPSTDDGGPSSGGSGNSDGPSSGGQRSGGSSSAAGAGGQGFAGEAPSAGGAVQVPTGPNPILFVTQVPIEGFTTLSSAFGNHRGDMQSAPRGGDLMIRYPDGTLRNLTQEAGFGSAGEEQDERAIAVREPEVHWSGTKAVFSMVIGAPPKQYEVIDPRWQLYEVTGLELGQTATITKVKDQPEEYNNVSPLYATNGVDILFTSDRPRGGVAHHYPQLDEYESAPTVTGLYRLKPGGELTLIEHAPSGAFSPTIDSFGRIIFTKWDHLQRDQQALEDYNPITYESEALEAPSTTEIAGQEVFPEPRETVGDVSGHTFNHFFPWEINEDGSAEETVNHVGRHEFGGSYTEGSFISDKNLSYYSPEEYHDNRFYFRGDGGTFHIRENPLHPGEYYATLAPEFYTAGSGRLVKFDGHPSKTGDKMVASPVTAEDEGHYRDPLPLMDGRLVAVYTESADYAEVDFSEDTSTNYAFALYELGADGDSLRAQTKLTEGIEKRVSWWDPDYRFTWDGPLWELDPVEVVSRPAPQPRTSSLALPEASVFSDLQIEPEDLRSWLVSQQLALIVMRNVTLRDRGDVHQPFNLRVPGGVEAIATEGKVYDIAALQLFQAEALRAYGERPGRRLLARALQQVPFAEAGPVAGTTSVGQDGSVAAFVPAERALSWQLVDPVGEPVVRERNWLSFQSGEIRTCPSCHGINSESQIGTASPENPPEALRDLLTQWLEKH